MPSREPKIDAYIATAAPFARPIVEYVREAVHAACPEVEEAVKWRMPFFDYHGPLCAVAAFKAHCALRFWKGDVLLASAAGHPGEPFSKLTSVKDLPPRKELIALLRAAMKLNDEGVKANWQVRRQEKRQAAGKKLGETPVPAELTAALKKNAKAQASWKAFPPSHRKEYAQWVGEAKRSETRDKRVAQTIGWLEDGKSRNWKYE